MLTQMNKKQRETRRLRWRLGLSIVFVVALVASFIWRQTMLPSEGALLPGQVRIAVPEWKGDRATGDKIELAYRDLPALNGDAKAPALILVHGSPMASEVMDQLIPALNEEYRLILLDLPGFGGSTRDVPDYSIRAHAHVVLDLMDALGIERANLLGYSQGSGVVINVADLAPERVESLTLLSGIGVQEYELMGDYTLNHGLYGMQLLVLTALYVRPHPRAAPLSRPQQEAPPAARPGEPEPAERPPQWTQGARPRERQAVSASAPQSSRLGLPREAGRRCPPT